MTVALVKQAIQAFLHTPHPQVLCIRGKWGVGKTHVWVEVFKNSKAEGAVALPYSSYVSLFGLQSIDEVRQAVFENRVTTKRIEIEPSFESLKENLAHYGMAASKQISKLSPFAKIPYIDSYIANFSGGFRHIVSLAVRDTIICFDDLERKKIASRDLLGLISFFKEQRNCKSVIILNDDAVTFEEKQEFWTYFEKVVDISIEFAPSATECADIAIREEEVFAQYIRENIIKLEISNIRIIYRIKTAALELARVLEPFTSVVKRQSIHTLVLMIWSKYDKNAIPIDFIKKLNFSYIGHFGKDDRTEEEIGWLPTLEAYGFRYCDPLDSIIMDGVEKGFFDDTALINEARSLDEQQLVISKKEALSAAWRTFHNSFRDDTSEVVANLLSAHKHNMSEVSRAHLDEVVTLFRALGFDGEASELVANYVESNKGKIKSVDDPDDPFHSIIKDQGFREALKTEIGATPRRPLKDVLIEMKQGLRKDDSDIISSASADDLYYLFKSLPGHEIAQVIDGSLFYRRVANAGQLERDFVNRSLQALERIGRESPINAIRVKKYGVKVETKIVNPTIENQT